MAIKRKTVVDQIEINRAGNVSVRLSLLLVDGEDELASKYHRTVIDPLVGAEAQMALVNKHLKEMGEALVTADDIARLDRFVTLAQE